MTEERAHQQARVYAVRALSELDALGLPPTPPNFTVWFAAHAGNLPDLARQIERLKAAGPIDQGTADSLYARFIAEQPERANLAETSARMLATLNGVRDAVGAAGDDAERYGQTLQTFGDSPLEDTEQMRRRLDAVMAETRAMAEANKALQERLDRSAKEIDSLRENLVTLKREASHDALTGLANRKAFDRTLAEHLHQLRHKPGFLCLVMLDVDHFKAFNDTHGHQMGDQVLKLVGHTLKTSIDAASLAARYGGEEFAVILPDRPLARAREVAEAIRRAVAEKNLTNRRTGKTLGRITLSAGVAEYILGETGEQMIARADKALYVAKAQGRNRVVAQNELDPAHLTG
ncbi:GGDEF domain-containing protein [Roseospirillum parvum]|uniref:diguanylate cyclase n=1 Tax=Roseospirillum parvum TaxID=83401 RepID=A0A1G8B6E3_9PROT|nr:GGDEF domain-containing protein [Roseospirillum parvum]SDH28715.1 diguanylate cyclase [Roseospirillum parvum]